MPTLQEELTTLATQFTAVATPPPPGTDPRKISLQISAPAGVATGSAGAFGLLTQTTDTVLTKAGVQLGWVTQAVRLENVAPLPSNLGAFGPDGVPQGQLLPSTDNILGGMPVAGLRDALTVVPGAPSVSSVVNGETNVPGVPAILGMLQGVLDLPVLKTVTETIGFNLTATISVTRHDNGARIGGVTADTATAMGTEVGAALSLLSESPGPANLGPALSPVSLYIPVPFVELTRTPPQPVLVDVNISINLNATAAGSAVSSGPTPLPTITVPLLPVPVPRAVVLFNRRQFNMFPDQRAKDSDKSLVALLVRPDSPLSGLSDLVNSINGLLVAASLLPTPIPGFSAVAELNGVLAALAPAIAPPAGVETHVVTAVGDLVNFYRDVDWSPGWEGIGHTSPSDECRSIIVIGPPGSQTLFAVADNCDESQGAFRVTIPDGTLAAAIGQMDDATVAQIQPPGAATVVQPLDELFNRTTFEDQLSSMAFVPEGHA